MKYLTRIWAASAAVLAVGNAAQAQQQPGVQQQTNWSVGAIGFASPSPFEGDDTEIQAFPFISYQGERFYLRGLEAGYMLLKPQYGPNAPSLQPTLSIIATARNLPGSTRDKFNGELGIRAGLMGDFGIFDVTAVQDVTGVHDGHELTATYSYRFGGRGKLSVIPSVGISWQSEGLAQHLWGVTAQDRSDMIEDGDDLILPVYDVPGSAFTYNAGLFVNYQFNDRWNAVVIGNARYLDSDIRDNPAIDRDVDLSVGLAIAYNF